MKTIKDQALASLESLFDAVKKENIRQIEKWGIQDRSPYEWLTWTTEELGELAQALADHEARGASRENVFKEAIQTATLCLKIAEMYK